MKLLKKIICLLVIGLLFVNCNYIDKWLEGPQATKIPVRVKVNNYDKHFNARNFSVKVDSVFDNMLGVRCNITVPQSINLYNDSLRTDSNFVLCVKYTFFSNEKVLYTNQLFTKPNWGYKAIYSDDYNLNCHFSDTLRTFRGEDSLLYILKMINKNGNNLSYELKSVFPYYIFNKLPKGKHNIKLNITVFIPALLTDSSSTILKQATRGKNILKANAKFVLNMPEVYNTSFYIDTLLLKDDETFNPHQMDFKLFGPGLPDMYWSLTYPYTSKHIIDEDYSNINSTYYESNTYRNIIAWPVKDSLILYFYSPKDSVLISIVDEDVLSGDDYISTWCGTVKDISATKNLENIEMFEIKHIEK